MKNRIKEIFSHCEKEVDAIVIANSSMPNLDMNFFYLTNLVDSGVFEHSYAVPFPDGHAVVVTSILEQAIAQKVTEERERLEPVYGEIKKQLGPELEERTREKEKLEEEICDINQMCSTSPVTVV